MANCSIVRVLLRSIFQRKMEAGSILGYCIIGKSYCHLSSHKMASPIKNLETWKMPNLTPLAC